MKKRVANIIIEQLLNAGVDTVFGITGKAISPFLDAILDYEKIRFISAMHESGAAYMAYGYAQGRRKVGVCCGTTGPGSTNLATGVSTAYMNSVPMLVFTGQISTHEFGKSAFQESTGLGRSINSVGFFKHLTKKSISIDSVENIPEIIQDAIRVATTGRMGPVHINIPFNIQLSSADYLPIETGYVPADEIKSSINESEIESVMKLIRNATNPVFLIGWGAALSGAGSEIMKLADELNIPMATTLQGKGVVPTDHPLCLGVLGVCGHLIAEKYVFEKSDLLIAIGTSFGEFNTFSWDKRFLKIKYRMQIDIDSHEIGKNFSVDVGIVGDAKEVVSAILRLIADSRLESTNVVKPFEFVADITSKFENLHMMLDNSMPVKPQRLMKIVQEYTPENTLFLADSGAHWAWAMHYLTITKNGGFYPTLGLGAMGASICSAIGVKLSKPDNPVVCICGDGSFLMTGNEIATAAQYQIPVIWIIFNDAKYNMPAFSSKMLYNRSIGVDLPQVNFSQLAEAHNVKGYRIEDPNDLPEVLTSAIALKRPVVIDVVIDPTEIPPIGKRKYNVQVLD
jgi:acetolactate synthase I/II/III large subunit